jgi:hypothetical protein
MGTKIATLEMYNQIKSVGVSKELAASYLLVEEEAML